MGEGAEAGIERGDDRSHPLHVSPRALGLSCGIPTAVCTAAPSLLPAAPSASPQLSQGWAVIAQPQSLATFRAPDPSAHPISLCLSIQLLRTTVWLVFLDQALWKDADFLGLIWTGEGLGAGWGL